jgi:hypothetical protein
MRMTRLLLFAVLASMALPSVASAADTKTSAVTGTIGDELSLAVATPALLTFTHTTPGTASSLATVTSTHASWTLSIADNNSGTNSGHMLKTAGAGAAAVGTPLNNALQWKSTGSYADLTGSGATVKTGSLIGTATIDYEQSLGASENVTLSDAYLVTVKLTVT